MYETIIMAKQSNNVVTHGMSGKIGDLLVFSQRYGKMIVSKVPHRTAKTSEKQMEHARPKPRSRLPKKEKLRDRCQHPE